MKLAITGVGIVSPLGNTLSDNIENLKAMQVPIQDYRPQGHFSDWILEVKKFLSNPRPIPTAFVELLLTGKSLINPN